MHGPTHVIPPTPSHSCSLPNEANAGSGIRCLDWIRCFATLLRWRSYPELCASRRDRRRPSSCRSTLSYCTEQIFYRPVHVVHTISVYGTLGLIFRFNCRLNHSTPVDPRWYQCSICKIFRKEVKKLDNLRNSWKFKPCNLSKSTVGPTVSVLHLLPCFEKDFRLV